MPVKRATRVASLLREVLSEILSSQIKDPAVGGLTISRVTLSNDLKNARIYYNLLGKEVNHDQIKLGLSRAMGFIRSEVARRTDLKHVPNLQFSYDDSLDYADRINQLLKQAGLSKPPDFTE